MRSIEQIHTQIICIIDFLVANLFSEIRLHHWKHIKRSVRRGADQSGNLTHQFQYPRPPFPELHIHIKGRFHVPGQSSYSSPLCHGIGTTRQLPLDLFAGFGHSRVSSNIAQAISSHGITFTEAIDQDHTVFNFSKLRNALMFADEIDILIDLI